MSSQRKFFGTDGIRGRVGVEPITAEFALKLGWAVGQILAQDQPGHVLIGKDTRISGYMLTAALEAGFIAAGLNVSLLGVVPTPAVAYLTSSLGAQMGVVVSASHNPFYDNGIKFFNSDGKKLPDHIEEMIEHHLNSKMKTVDAYQIGSSTKINDSQGRYVEFCKRSFSSSLDLKGMKIVVDCAHGATYQIAPNVFSELGAKVVPIHCQPDGFNINEKCGSTYIEPLQKAVLEHQAELGIAFDGDGDRVIFIDDKGEVVDGDELLFIMALYYQAQERLQGGVVGTLMSNLGLEKALEKRHIPFVRSKVGDRYVMDSLLQKGWRLGGEGSGHLICLDKTSTGDGIVSALTVLEALCYFNTSLHKVKQDMNKNAQVLLNVPAKEGARIVSSQRVEAMIKDAELRLSNRGRILLRSSGTEPVVRIMVEGEDKGFIIQIAEDIAQVVKEEASTSFMP